MLWLWHGYLAPGNVTLLTSQWKSGKTTLIAVLLNRLRAWGRLAGRAVAPGKAIVISEESTMHWQLRSQKLAFGDHVCWLCQPFAGRPHPHQWQALLDHILGLRRQHGIDLVAIDTLASFFPGRTENAAAAMLETVMPLQRLTSAGMSVLLAHHPRKGEVLPGQAARGSGALSGYVDILIERGWHGPPNSADRRRRLRGYSRYEETPRRLLIELTPDGQDYLALGDFEDSPDARWTVLEAVLQTAGGKLTRRDIQAAWPANEPAPDAVTLWRWLDAAVHEGRLLREGTGHKNNPYRPGPGCCLRFYHDACGQ